MLGLGVRVRYQGLVLRSGLGLMFANEKFSEKNFWGLLMKIFLGLKKFLGFANENFFWVKKIFGVC